jgi:hypothetical protein
MILGAIFIGFNRQGIDVLAIRLIVVGGGLVLGWTLSDAGIRHSAICSPGIACVRGYVSGVLFGGLVVALMLGAVAIPVRLLMDKGPRKLKPELRWAIVSSFVKRRPIVSLLVGGTLVLLLALFADFGAP